MRIPSDRFEENTLHFQGSKTRSPQPASNVTQARAAEMQTIYYLAQANNVPVDYVVTKILANSQAELQAYVQSKGETPLTDPTALALQAVLLRANDVAIVANALDISDEDALQVIENNLQEDIDTNSPAVSDSPPIAVQAALACAMQYASEQASASGIPSTMGGIVSSVQSAAQKYRSASKVNNDDSSDPTDWMDEVSGDMSTDGNDPSQDAAVSETINAPASITSALASIPGGYTSSVSPATTIPSIAVNASTLPQASGGVSAGGIFNSISSVFSSISNIANQAKSTASTLGNAVSNAGANGITTYVQQNSSTIMIFAVIIIVVIVLAINASKRG